MASNHTPAVESPTRSWRGRIPFQEFLPPTMTRSFLLQIGLYYTTYVLAGLSIANFSCLQKMVGKFTFFILRQIWHHPSTNPILECGTRNAARFLDSPFLSKAASICSSLQHFLLLLLFGCLLRGWTLALRLLKLLYFLFGILQKKKLWSVLLLIFTTSKPVFTI